MNRIAILCIALLMTITSNIANAEIEMFCEGPQAHYLFKQDPIQVFERGFRTNYELAEYKGIGIARCGQDNCMADCSIREKIVICDHKGLDYALTTMLNFETKQGLIFDSGETVTINCY